MTDSKHTRWVYSETDEGDQIGVPYYQVCQLEEGEVISASDPGDEDDIGHLIAAAPDLLTALQAMTDRYCELVDSGDCGFWNSSEDEEVIAARAALSKALNAKVL